MTIDRWIRFFAGTFVLASLALAHFVCPLTYVLRALGVSDAPRPATGARS